MYKYFLFLLVLGFASCKKDTDSKVEFVPGLMEIPKGFPEIDFPEDNAFTKERWNLGKKLFYDPVFSIDNSISCASCHLPSLAFSDEVSLSLGVEDRVGRRNTPSLANVGYHPYFTREGGVPTLEMHVLVPIQEHVEFDFNIVLIAERLKSLPNYVEMAQKAYNREIDAFVITRSIATFQRSLLSGFSPYDQFKSYNDKEALSSSAQNGMTLFFSEKTHCSSCHSGFNFTNYAFENNGIYEVYEDEGRLHFTEDEADRALFKVPSLRNVGVTSPYMHDGSMSSLGEVLDNYISGGKDCDQKSDILQPLDLSISEKNDLINFLHSLTDQTFINNPLFKK